MSYTIDDYPKPSQLKWAMLVVLYQNDRPMVASEIDRNVAKLLNVSDQMYETVLENGKQYMPYRLGWERTKSKKFGYIEKVPKEQSREDGEALFDFSSHIQTLFHRAESL